jgi:long-chain acyl-CoA synthetase
MNIASLLTRSAASHGPRIAVRQGSSRLTFTEVSEQVSRFGSGLRALGLSRGDRIGLYMNNRPEYAIAMMAAFRAGFVAVPINVRLHPSELDYILQHCDARALVHGPNATDALSALKHPLDLSIAVAEPPRGTISFEEVLGAGDPTAGDEEVDPNDLAWLFYTSGTTGRPKGAQLSHRNLECMTESCLADVCSFQPEDVLLHVAPLSHGSGLYLIPALARGAENAIFAQRHFDPVEVLATIERERVTVIPFLAPTMIVMLMSAPPAAELNSLRAVIYGGAPIHAAHARAALERFGPVLVQIYGQGEAPMTISTLGAADHRPEDDVVLASAGTPHADVEVMIVDADDREVPAGGVGEVVVRGDVVMRGYWNDEAATAEALRGGWLHTGDIGRIGADGRLYLLDRKHDLIITGGANVYPRQVEETLLLHPSVAEAAVFGIPDSTWGERVAAAIVARPGCQPDANELVAHCRRHIASFKKPTRIAILDRLPKNAYGKILKRELRDRLTSDETGS